MTLTPGSSHAGQTLGEAIGVPGLEAPVYGTVEEAMKSRPEVFVEFTKPEIARHHILTALQGGRRWWWGPRA